MSDYDKYMYENYCPWCDEAYKDVDHSAGCPNPKSPPTERAKKQIAFNEWLYKSAYNAAGDT